mmetsp:Transcript_26978/g.54344  ORF Transcript_26978/g.54344 Transcript_26978/m.54344 type:complete len:84 (-) Transcript_26978:67-318(-)
MPIKKWTETNKIHREKKKSNSDGNNNSKPRTNDHDKTTDTRTKDNTCTQKPYNCLGISWKKPRVHALPVGSLFVLQLKTERKN